MITTPPIYRSDIGPLQFAVAVIVGSVGSAALSYLHVPAWASVGFALVLMVVLALLRLRTASKFKDFQSLEAFAEDIYLLGYLLTLAALLGLVPRLMSDEANLFQIAGLKLVTTVVGLALMMIFRQIARRWADDEERGAVQRFAQQQQVFSDAVARLNQGADELTSKLNDIVQQFDPELLAPLAEWSNRAAGAFSAATNSLAAVPTSVENGMRSLTGLSEELERAKLAAGQLAGMLTVGTTPAANVFTTELGQATQAAVKLGVSVTALQPAGDAARDALQNLGAQAGTGAAKFGEIGDSLHRTALELGKVERALKKLVDLHATDPEMPMTRLVQALESSAANTAASTARFETVQSDLKSVASANHELAQRMESQITAPLVQHQQALDRVQQQLIRSGEQIEQTTKQLEIAAAANRPDPAAAAQLLTRLGELRSEMSQTNAQIKTLVARLDAAALPDGKPGFFSRFVAGGSR